MAVKHFFFFYSGDESEEEEEIEKVEEEIATQRMKNGKAAGEDMVTPEMIKAGGRVLIGKITELFQAAWHEGWIPVDWQRNSIIPLHKKGDSSKCENYRAVCLTNVIAKIYSKVLERRLREHVESDMEEEQAGFRTADRHRIIFSPLEP